MRNFLIWLGIALGAVACSDLDAAADDDVNPSQSWSATLSTSGTDFTLSQSCPGADGVAGSYTADGDTLTLLVLDHGVLFGEAMLSRTIT